MLSTCIGRAIVEADQQTIVFNFGAHLRYKMLQSVGGSVGVEDREKNESCREGKASYIQSVLRVK
jgi:hypothetical protein